MEEVVLLYVASHELLGVGESLILFQVLTNWLKLFERARGDFVLLYMAAEEVAL